MYSHCFPRTFQPQKIKPPRNFDAFSIIEGEEYFLEIGAGKGKHALLFTKEQPHAHLMAIERTKEKFSAFQKQIVQLSQHHVITNLTAIHADAIAWTVHALPPKCLVGVFILYPNPEPNNANQRWLNMPFFEFLLSRLQDNGEIILATNIQTYAQEAEVQAKNVWQLPCYLSNVPKTSERTHFEKKYLQRGETCWQLTLTKPKNYKTSFDTLDFTKN